MTKKLAALSSCALLLLTAAGARAEDSRPVFPAPVVSDPMLTPPPAATRKVDALNDALQLLRARSADLRVAYLEVARAEAQSRSALAALLPSLNGQVGVTHQFITHRSGQSVATVDPATGNTLPANPGIVTPTENTASFGANALPERLLASAASRAREREDERGGAAALARRSEARADVGHDHHHRQRLHRGARRGSQSKRSHRRREGAVPSCGRHSPVLCSRQRRRRRRPHPRHGASVPT